MCMKDEQIGRELMVQSRAVSVAGGSAIRLCEPDPLRVRLVISTAAGAIVWVGPQSDQPAANSGYALTTTVPQMTIDVKTWGKLVESPWFAFVAVGPEILHVMEGTLGEV